MAMELLMKGALKYKITGAREYLNKLKSLPNAMAVMVTCVDTRLFPSQIFSSEPGNMYVVRNAGNFVPPARSVDDDCSVLSTMELACIRNSVNDILICGHSDCKAMHLLNSMGAAIVKGKLQLAQMSPLQKWIAVNGIEGFRRHELKPEVLEFPVNEALGSPGRLVLKTSTLKPLNLADQLSQINVLQQMSHVYSHPFLAERLRSQTLRVHGLWFYLNSGQLNLYSRLEQAFVPVTEDTLKSLLLEIDP